MDKNTQQNAEMVEESTAASHGLARETDELARLIEGFDVGKANAKRASSVSPNAGQQSAAAQRIAVNRRRSTSASSEDWAEF